jgi:hypothetical protein
VFHWEHFKEAFFHLFLFEDFTRKHVYSDLRARKEDLKFDLAFGTLRDVENLMG